MPQPLNNVLGNPNNVSPTASTVPVTNSVPLSSLPTPSTAQPVSGIVDAPNPPPAGSTTAGFTSQTPPDNNPNTAPPATATANQSSPDGVKTPEQIYEELKLVAAEEDGESAGESAGIISATVGAILLLFHVERFCRERAENLRVGQAKLRG